MQKLAVLGAAAVVNALVAACADPASPPPPRVPDAPAAQAAAQPATPGLGRPPALVDDEYIVVLHDSVTDVHGAAARLAARHGESPHFVYDAAIKGFAVHATRAQADALARSPNVAYVEQDQVYTADATQSPTPSWGIDRIDQRNLPLSNSYTFINTALNVYAYIIDTGIQTSHPDFNGRAAVVYDALGGNGQDCNGHGTHVAGTVGGTRFGVAKQVRLRAVRVLDCNGVGSTSGVLAGINYVRLYHLNPAVANLSLGGGYSATLNAATTNLVNSGVYVAVAAGNSNANACNYSPASAGGVLTVAASTSVDAKASYSNWGPCVELYAPGSSITSDWIGGGFKTLSGTSMASPHAAGVAALLKGTYGNLAAPTITSWIVNTATPNKIVGNPVGTPNRLLFKNTL